MEEAKLFDEWNWDEVEITDKGLERYIDLGPIIVPNTFGRHANQRFNKSEVSIVERLINKLMVPGHKGSKHWKTSGICTGKKSRAIKILKEAFETIEEKTDKNPIQVLARAVENSAPRAEVTTIQKGGMNVPKQVDSAPQRRVDLALRWIIQGTFQSTSFDKTTAEEALSQEIMAASRNDKDSLAVSKRVEMERQAKASR